jgi:hypothetical protein
MKHHENSIIARLWLAARPAAMVALVGLAISVFTSAPAYAGKMSALEGLVRAVMEDSRAEAKAGAKIAGEAHLLRGGEELFENAARQHELMLRTAGRMAELDERAIAKRLAKLAVPANSEAVRALEALSVPERHFVVEAAETAGALCRKYPGQATSMIRQLGPEGLSYVRVYGDDVAQIVLKEGPESLGVLRKGGRAAWGFFKEDVLPHKKKLIAAGVLAAFLANPDQFVDMAGRATDYAVREFARAGVELASVVPGAVSQGVHAGVSSTLDRWGLNYGPVRWTAFSLALLIAAAAGLRLIGRPLRTLALPLTLVVRRLRRQS